MYIKKHILSSMLFSLWFISCLHFSWMIGFIQPVQLSINIDRDGLKSLLRYVAHLRTHHVILGNRHIKIKSLIEERNIFAGFCLFCITSLANRCQWWWIPSSTTPRGVSLQLGMYWVHPHLTAYSFPVCLPEYGRPSVRPLTLSWCAWNRIKSTAVDVRVSNA